MTSHNRQCAFDGAIVCGLWLSTALLLRPVEGAAAVALVLALLPLRTRGAPLQERVAQVAFELWLVPGLVFAGVCALASVAGTTRLMVALPPILAWTICIPVGAWHGGRRRGGGLGARGSLWGALATTALLAAVLGALMFRDRTRLPLENVDGYLAALEAAGAPTVLAPAENPCSHMDDLPTCRFVVGTGGLCWRRADGHRYIRMVLVPSW